LLIQISNFKFQLSNPAAGGEEMKASQDDYGAFNTAMRGSRAVIDYSGLLGWSILSRSGCAIGRHTSKMGKRIGRNVADPYTAIKKKLRKGADEKVAPDNEAILRIEERIAIIEKKLADLEKHGVRMVETGEYQKKHKELDEERRGLLALIVEENKELRTLLNT
jgi:hypothetical protein